MSASVVEMEELGLSGSLDHFHVHIVDSNYAGLQGMSTGQAHMLANLISLVRHSISSHLEQGR